MKRRIVWLALIFLTFAISSNCAPIDERIAVPIGGIQQWLSFKGANDKAPVFLFLHGGPGNSAMDYADKFTGALQKHFVCVQWDQRESGHTAALNKTDKPLTVEQMVTDAVEVIRYLRKRFSKERIYVMGHSWGGLLALMAADHNPELLEACFAVNPMINQNESERLALDWMLQRSHESKNDEALRDLARVKIPFETVEQLYYDRKWINRFAGKSAPSRATVMEWGKKWFPMFMDASGINLITTTPEIKCPVYFLIGGKDRQTHFSVAETYFKSLKAEKKELFWFKDSGHNLPTAEPVRLQEIVISILTKN